MVGQRRIWLLPLLLAAGLALAAWQPVGLGDLLEWGRVAAGQPWLTAAVVLAMMLLYAFGLPGTLGLWLIAPFHPPLVATALLVSGSVGGALGAYALSDRLRGDWRPGRVGRRVVTLLEREGGLLTQLALRILPGFPHSVVNFAAGMLRLPLRGFVLAALLGLTVKWSVYASAVHGVIDAVENGTALRASTLAPLAALSVLLMLGTLARQRVAAR